MESEIRYFLRRASEEARRAISAEQSKVGAIHQSLSIRYSAKALILLAQDDKQFVSRNAISQ
jgi:hypothetical protein